MENFKKYLTEEIDEDIKKKGEELKESDEELEILEARIRVEEKLSKMEDINEEEIKKDIKYSVEAIKSMILIEKNRNEELKRELKMLKYRRIVIDKFEEGEL